MVNVKAGIDPASSTWNSKIPTAVYIYIHIANEKAERLQNPIHLYNMIEPAESISPMHCFACDIGQASKAQAMMEDRNSRMDWTTSRRKPEQKVNDKAVISGRTTAFRNSLFCGNAIDELSVPEVKICFVFG